MAPETYGILNKVWHSSCRILLGSEIGELKEYEKWLTEFVDHIGKHASSTSSSEVVVAIPDYCKGAKFAGLDEIDFNKKFEPLKINDIKDIDSIISAVQERAHYTGSVVLGNSQSISGSTNVVDSNYVLNSAFISDSKYVAYSTFARYTESVFGVNNDVKSNILIVGSDAGMDVRCLGIYGSYLCNDSYYLAGCEDCSDAIFCFNLVGKRRIIRNLELPKEKYSEVKAALVEQFAAELQKKKRLPSLIEIVSKCKGNSGENSGIFEKIKGKTSATEKTDMAPIEKSFSKACEVVLGRSLKGGIRDYENWLVRHVKDVWSVKSAISGREVVVGDFPPYNLYSENRIVRLDEAREAALVLKMDEKDALSLSFDNAHEKIAKIAYFKTESRLRENFNLVKTAVAYNARDCYRGAINSNVKYSACSYWPRNSEYNFGCSVSFSCSFCINTYFSNNISRSMEIDSCNNCAGSYYLHNCENVQDGMFCFNIKNKRHAIGNAEVGKEKFADAKAALLDWVCERLEKKRSLDIDIYNIACYRKK